MKNSGAITSALLEITTHDVILRHIRSRPGPDNSVNGSGNLDALSINGLDVFNIIIDHVSMSWSVDETASIFRDAHDITIQWSIFSEALFCSNHKKTIESAGSGGPCPGGGEPHSRVMTISTFPGDSLSPTNISLHHNLCAHGNKRYPNININTLVDFVNNVIYNLGTFGASLGNEKNPDDAVKLNYVKNYVAPGANTLTDRSVPAIKSAGSSQAFPHQIFLDGNEVLPPILVGG